MKRASHPVVEPELERRGQRMIRPAAPFLGLATALATVGIVLLIVAQGWVWTLGIVLIALSLPLGAIGGGLVTAGGVSRWAARHRPFA